MSIGYVETPEQEVLRLREQNRQWLEESTKLLAELEQLRKENERLRLALTLAVRQNEHDMLMTGEELRQCREVIAKATGMPP